jgi:hypothetical protein
MKKLLLATVRLVALTVGAQAKPAQLGLIDNSWVDYIIDTERTKFEPEQIAEEAKKFTVKVTCGE